MTWHHLARRKVAARRGEDADLRAWVNGGPWVVTWLDGVPVGPMRKLGDPEAHAELASAVEALFEATP